jgi:hypothetical protein
MRAVRRPPGTKRPPRMMGGIRPRIPVASGGIPSETRVARLAQRTTKKTPATRRMARAVEGQTSSRILSGSLAVSRLSVVWSRFRRSCRLCGLLVGNAEI